MTDNTLKPYVIGLDLGGTNSVFGIVDARGEIKATTAIKTGGYGKVEDYVKAAVEALQPIIDTVGGIDKIKAMGIGAPNANYYNGTIEFAPNLPWAHDGVVPLADLFSKALGGLPVGMTNDANAAALGEMTYGAAGKGDKLALRVYEFTGKMLGEACADFAAFSSPEAFVFFGGLTKAGDLIMKPIQKAYDEHVLRTFKGKAKFLVSTLDGSSAAVLGASAVAWDM